MRQLLPINTRNTKNSEWLSVFLAGSNESIYAFPMIRNVADLLTQLIAKLAEKSDAETKITHPGVIGEMYEGVAAKALEHATAFDGLDIQIASGFVEDDKGGMSKAADVMICVGSGRPVSNTNRRIYNVKDVIMIVEVKKRLRARDLKEALLWFRDYWKKLDRPGKPRLPELVHSSWRLLMRKPWPTDEDLEAFTDMEDTVFRRIVTEARMPARIVFSFGGYKNEDELRKGFGHAFQKIGFLSAPPALADVNALPNLIICGNACLIKLDGLPYPGLFHEPSGTWFWYASKTGTTFLPLLEILWTRLQTRFDLPPDIFGDDLENEGVNRFGSARIIQQPSGQRAWDYVFEPLHAKEPQQEEFLPWEPAELTQAEFSVLNVLCAMGEADLDHPAFRELLAKHALTEENLVSGLRDKGFVGVRGRHLELLTEHLQCMVLGDGRVVAAENNSGRLSAYAANYMKERRNKI